MLSRFLRDKRPVPFKRFLLLDHAQINGSIRHFCHLRQILQCVANHASDESPQRVLRWYRDSSGSQSVGSGFQQVHHFRIAKRLRIHELYE